MGRLVKNMVEMVRQVGAAEMVKTCNIGRGGGDVITDSGGRVVNMVKRVGRAHFLLSAYRYRAFSDIASRMRSFSAFARHMRAFSSFARHACVFFLLSEPSWLSGRGGNMANGNMVTGNAVKW